MLQWVESHPYLAGSLAVGIIVIFVLLKNSGSSSTPTVVSSGPSDSVTALGIQSAAAVQGAQIQGNNEIAGYNAQVNAIQLTTAADIEKARIQSTVDLTSIFATVDLTKYQTDAALKLGLAQVGAQTPLPASAAPTTTAPAVYGTSQSQAAQYQDAQAQAAAISAGAGSMSAASGEVYQLRTTDVGYVAPGTGGRPSYGDLLSSGQIVNCDQSTVGGQNACAQKNESVLEFYNL